MGSPVVIAALLIANGRILAARRPDTDALAGLWEFPGGKLEADETEHECLARELKEELGIDTDIGDFFGESRYNYSKGEILLRAYWAFPRSLDIRLNFHAQVIWDTPSELSKLPFAPADIPLISALAATKL